MRRSYLSSRGVEQYGDRRSPLLRNSRLLSSAGCINIIMQEDLLALERLIALSPSRIACLPPDLTEYEISSLLHEISESCHADRCGLWALSRNKAGIHAKAVNVSRIRGTAPIPETFSFRDTFPWTGENLSSGNIVCFTTLDELPPQADVDRRQYEALGIQSALAIPMYCGGKVKFFIGVHHVGCRSIWRNEAISLVRLAGEIFVNALDRCDDWELAVKMRFEQLVSDLSVRLINVSPQQLDREVADGLRLILHFFKCDRCGLVTFTPDKREILITHVCYGEGIEAVPERMDVGHMFPWSKERLLKGGAIHFSSPDELPPDAEVDRRSYLAMGTKSQLIIPINVGGSVDYIFAFQDVRAVRKRNADLIPRLRLLGELFVNAIVRCRAEAAQDKTPDSIGHLKDIPQTEVECQRMEMICSHPHEEIIGQSEALARTLVLSEKVAPTNSTVLICGETGTGKELIAREIHKLSLRGDNILVKVNCASLPASLVESELFGREKGAYTGALTRQAGRFEMADNGTIFLDEIAEMSPELQAKLLRVLQEGEFERLGSTKTVKVDVRVIAATNRNLAEEVRKGNFREDLYYRLNVFQIVVPPLRERLEDIPLLVWAFLDDFGEKMGKKINRISKQDMAALQRYHWPGNVRELRNVVEHAVIVSTGDRLLLRLPENGHKEPEAILTLEEYEIKHIQEALRLTGWRIKGEDGAARLLGLNPSTLYSRIHKLGISLRNDKDEMSP